MNAPKLRIEPSFVALTSFLKFACAALVLTLASVHATPITWTNAAGGNWNNAANWNPNQVPNGPSDDALITSTGTYIVTLDIDVTLNSLTLGGTSGSQTLVDPSQNLTLNSVSAVETNGLLSLEGGVLAGSGLLTVSGKLNWTGGRIGAGSTLTLAPSGVLLGMGSGGFLEFSGVLTNFGTIKLASGIFRCIAWGNYGGGYGLLVNSPSGLIDFQADVSLNYFNDNSGIGTPSLINRGMVSKSAGSGTSFLNVPFYNSGTVDVHSATLAINAGGSGSGVFQAETGATLSYPADYEVDGLMTGPGTNLLNGAVLALKGTIAGQFVWVSGRLGTNTVATVATNGVLVGAVVGGYLEFSGILTNAGIIKLTSGIFRCIAYAPYGGGYGLLVNSPNGLIDFQADVPLDAFNDNSGVGTPTVINAGTVRKSADSGLSSINPLFYNSGTLDVQSGSLSLHGGGNGKGVFHAAAGATLDFSGDYQVDSGLTGAGTNTFNSGVVVLNGSLTTSNAVLSGSVLGGTNAVLADHLTWTSGRIGAGSTLTLAPGAVLLGMAPGGYLELSGVLTNLGTINLTNGIFRCIAYSLYGGGYGLLVNSPGGRIDFQADVPLAHFNDNSGVGAPALINQGLVLKSAGSGTSSLDVPLYNSGTIDVQKGTVAINGGGNGSGVFQADAGATLAYPADYEVDGLMTGPGTNLLNAGVLALKGTIAGQFVWVAGRLGTNTVGTVATNGVLVTAPGGGTLEFSGILTNAGAIKLTSGTFRCIAYGPYGGGYGLLVNLPSGLIDFQADVQLAAYNDGSGVGTPTLINQGTLRKSGGSLTSLISPSFLNQSGAIEVDSGQLSVGSSSYLQGAGPLTIELGGQGAGQFGEFSTDSSASLGGPLNVSLANGFAPAVGNQFQILSCASRSGTFTTLKVPTGTSVNYSNNGVFLVITSTVPALQITSQPANQTVAAGGTAMFTVSATGAGQLSYHWQENGTNLHDAGNLFGSATSLLTISNVSAANVGTYAVLITDTAGSTLTSSNATLALISCLSPPSGLVGWWPAEGNANDISGGDNGTLQGGATFAPGKVGQAFSLNGTDAYVQAPNSSALDPTAAGSQAAWVYLNQLPSVAGHYMEVIAKGGAGTDFEILAGLDNSFHFYVGGGTRVDSTTVFQTGVWYHVVGAWDSTVGLKIYVNGVLENINSAHVTRSPSGLPLEIGNHPYFGPRLLNGLIDEAQVYNRALTDLEVAAIYSAGSAGLCTTCLLTCPANIVATNTTGQCGAIVNYTVPSASGNCGPVVCTPTNGSFFPIGSATVSCTTTGGANCSFTVIIHDTQPPAILCPANIVRSTDPNQCTASNVTFTVTATCPGVTLACSPLSGSTFTKGVTPVNCVATDPTGNTNKCSFTVTVNDTQPPAITCSTNIVANAPSGQTNLVVNFPSPTVTDNCPGVTASCKPLSGSAFPLGATPVTCTATDAASNTATCIFTVTVNSTSTNPPPSITCPADISTNTAPGQCARILAFAPTATAPAVTCRIGATAITSPYAFPSGTSTVTCTASNSAGTASCSFTVTIHETEPPVIPCPTALAVQCDADVPAPNPALIKATDNCDPAPIVAFVSDVATGTCPKTILRTYKATDLSSNSAICTQTITVHDTIAPVIAGCTNLTVATPPGELGTTVNFTVAATDNCDGPVPVSCTPLPGYFAVGQTPVTCEAVDRCGNLANCSFMVTVTAGADSSRMCSFGQGFYGNANGKFNGNTSLVLVGQLLSQGPLVLGKIGSRSLTILPGDASLLELRLPAGGQPAALPSNGDQTLQTSVLTLNSKDRFANVFLGQTITLALNSRLSPLLSSFALTSGFCTQGVLPGADGLKGTSDDAAVTNDIQQFSIPATVLGALLDPALGIKDASVNGLLTLANRALANLPVGIASLSDINNAVDAVNRGFDQCRQPGNCGTRTITQDSFNDSFNSRPTLGSGGTNSELNLEVRSSNLGATKEPGEPNIAGNPGGKSVWWQWRAPRSGPVTIATLGSSFDVLLGVYTGTTISNLVLVASNDDAGGALASVVAFQAEAGTNYQISVDGFDGASGEIVMTLIVDRPQLCQSLTVINNHVQFCVNGDRGRIYTVEASPDLVNWTLVATGVSTNGVLGLTDRAMSNFPKRHYRVMFEP